MTTCLVCENLAALREVDAERKERPDWEHATAGSLTIATLMRVLEIGAVTVRDGLCRLHRERFDRYTRGAELLQ
jgi:hypothetical protein